MANPQVTNMELSTGTCVPLSFDLETGTPVEIYLTGSDLQNLSNIELDSGPMVSWYITGITSSANSAIITAYATGEPGGGYVQVLYRSNPLAGAGIDEFWVPFVD